MTPVELSSTVLRAVRRAVDEGELVVALPEKAQVVPPGPGGRGDYATNVALQLARPAGRPPHEVAEILRSHLSEAAGVARVDITGPGFLNVTLVGRGTALVTEVLRRRERYGYADGPTGQVVRLHYPAEVRAAVTGQVLARILRSQGALVRISCEAPLDPVWAGPLGVTVDTHGMPGTPDAGCVAQAPGHGPGPAPAPAPAPAPLDINLRPVPSGQDPTPLGRDAARWALLHPAAHDHPRITDEHLVQREGNPLFRVQYAYTRATALSRNAAALGFAAVPGDCASSSGGSGSSGPLLDALDTYPHALAAAARHRAPDRLARHLVTVADALLACLHTVLPLGDEKPSAAHRSRLALAEAAGTVLAGGLSLLGIDAPGHI
ncbi:ArgS-related anticodon-binding protein NrtL [Streptomyces sp. FR-108]|uniref:ArgS-related anticodon-binding protein NrtL n=1 Tax=Streptomyces sp. FR-108 TaxID=3416665 RepID=UPI003CF80188